MVLPKTVLMALLLGAHAAMATDYIVDFSRVRNLESLRPLVRGCADFDALEPYRAQMQSSDNLETMRAVLTPNGMALFNRCPDGIAGEGIAAVKKSAAVTTPSYSVDFTRVKDFETLRPLVKGCKDFGDIEQLRQRLTTSANLNDLASTLRNIGFGMFDGCPAHVEGVGITPSSY